MGRTSRSNAATSRPSRAKALNNPYPIPPRTTRARTTTTAQTTRSTTEPTLAAAAGRLRGLHSVPGERGTGVGGHLSGQLPGLVGHRRAAEGRDQPAGPSQVGGPEGAGQPPRGVLDGGPGVPRVIVGAPAGVARQPQPDRGRVRLGL